MCGRRAKAEALNPGKAPQLGNGGLARTNEVSVGVSLSVGLLHVFAILCSQNESF
jgi:hypothetical protein